jgi:hypothetical protein
MAGKQRETSCPWLATLPITLLSTDGTRGSLSQHLRCVMSDRKQYQLNTRTVLTLLNGAVGIIHYIRYGVCQAL